MSAFLCSSYHVGRLAAYIVAKQERYVKYHADVPETLVGEELARLVSAKLAVALITSIQARYPDTIENFSGAPGVISDTAEGEGGYLTACAQAASLDWRSDHRPEDMRRVRPRPGKNAKHSGSFDWPKTARSQT